MKLLFALLTFWTIAAFGQKAPPVYFNHVLLVIDSAALNAIRNSDFIKNQFAVFYSRTVQAENGRAWTGAYLYGIDSYFEIFEPSGLKAAGENYSLGDAG